MSETSTAKNQDMSEYEALKLENQVCFPLYACSRETIKKYKPQLDPLEITYTQYIVLLVLWERKTINTKELGNMLFLDSGTLTPLLKKMEQKGLLTRKRDPEDERNLIVTITENGLDLREAAKKIPYNMMNCINLNQEESLQLYRLLYKLLGRECKL